MLMTLSPAFRVSRLFCSPKCCCLHISAGFATKKITHYEVLDVARDATQEQIRAAYVKKSKELHPDLNPNEPHTHDKFIRMTEAYNTLIKQSSRHEYDMSLRGFVERRRMKRSAYSSHTSASGSTRPGSSFNQPEADERVFWDETIWPMRDKSKDNEDKDKPYYGFKGLKRQPNSYILAGIVVWIMIGTAIHFLIFSSSRDFTRNAYDQRDIKFHSFYMESRAKAKLHGNELQMQLLQDQYRSNNNEP